MFEEIKEKLSPNSAFKSLNCPDDGSEDTKINLNETEEKIFGLLVKDSDKIDDPNFTNKKFTERFYFRVSRDIIYKNIFDPESDLSNDMNASGEYEKLGIIILNNKIKISNINKFRKNIDKFTKKKLVDTFGNINNKLNKSGNEIFMFLNVKIGNIVLNNGTLIRDMINTNSVEKTKNNSKEHQKKPKLEQVIFGPPTPSLEQIKKYQNETAIKLNNIYGHKINQTIIDSKDLTIHYQIIDTTIHKKIEYISNLFNSNTQYKRNEIKQAQDLLDFIKHSWGSTNYNVLKDVKNLARQTIKQNNPKKGKNNKKSKLSKKENLESKLDTQPKNSNELNNDEFNQLHFDNFYEILEYIEKENPESFIISDKVRKQAKQSKFQKLDDSYHALNCLATRFLERLSNENKNGSKEELDILIRETSGFSYGTRQFYKTINKYPEDHTTKYNGKTIQLHKHLKFGSNVPEESMIRIGFEYIVEEQKILLGFIGRHQKS